MRRLGFLYISYLRHLEHLLICNGVGRGELWRRAGLGDLALRADQLVLEVPHLRVSVHTRDRGIHNREPKQLLD